MTPSVPNADGPTALDLSTQQSALILDRLVLLSRVDNTTRAAGLLHELVRLLNVGSAAFLCVIRAVPKRTTCRSLLACDPRWCAEFSQHNWYAHNPWLRYASEADEPIHGDDLPVGVQDADFMRLSLMLGFRSAWIVPVQDVEAPSRVTVLALGSTEPHTFKSTAGARLQVLSRCLAAELQRCMLRHLRDEFIQQTGLTPAELDLMRWHHKGLGSKKIADLLSTRPVTVDSRFCRVLSKLGAVDRHTATRLSRLYGAL